MRFTLSIPLGELIEDGVQLGIALQRLAASG
jgi:hypothetical protein